MPLIDIDSDTQEALWCCEQKSMIPSLFNNGTIGIISYLNFTKKQVFFMNCV